ncbi:MAG: DUF368 domain-containing protein [Phaeodactylibacter sp.]|nr:DUF368 domain-containing protein [Phaeodactylibacter sp.]
MEQNNWRLWTALKGMAMGIAEVIPGVSGGTIAFITGIYERLINAIKAFGPQAIQGLRQDGLKGGWKAVDGNFLFFLIAGMAVGVIAGVFGITYILEHYPPLIWAFFFGLIIASVLYMVRQVPQWNVVNVLALILAGALAYWITIAAPAQGTDALWFVFISGAIAISAMILPGISGSFMLLLMGMYTLIIPSVKEALKTFETQSLIILVVFALGCVLGLAVFSRILSWTFERYRSTTLAALTGFMLGSLNRIWPWRNVLSYRTNSRGESVPFREANVWPGSYEGDPLILGAVVCLILGFGLVFLLDRMDRKRTKA